MSDKGEDLIRRLGKMMADSQDLNNPDAMQFMGGLMNAAYYVARQQNIDHGDIITLMREAVVDLDKMRPVTSEA
jgi:hypothetical protein